MGLVIALSVGSCTTAFAGWEQTGATWKYQSAGTYYNDGWHWIDGNGDNIAECYFFNIDSTMLSNTTTTDNFTVNESGAWTVNGVVQTKVLNDNASSTGHSNPQSQAPVENNSEAVEIPGANGQNSPSVEGEKSAEQKYNDMFREPNGTCGGGQGADGEWYN